MTKVPSSDFLGTPSRAGSPWAIRRMTSTGASSAAASSSLPNVSMTSRDSSGEAAKLLACIHRERQPPGRVGPLERVRRIVLDQPLLKRLDEGAESVLGGSLAHFHPPDPVGKARAFVSNGCKPVIEIPNAGIDRSDAIPLGKDADLSRDQLFRAQVRLESIENRTARRGREYGRSRIESDTVLDLGTKARNRGANSMAWRTASVDRPGSIPAPVCATGAMGLSRIAASRSRIRNRVFKSTAGSEAPLSA